MKAKHNYIDTHLNRWILNLDEQKIQVFCNGDCRSYHIPEKIISTKQTNEYVFIYVEDEHIKFYQFKFEEDMFLVGDKFDKEDEFIDSFACHIFDEIA